MTNKLNRFIVSIVLEIQKREDNENSPHFIREVLRANACKNRAKSKFRGHSQKIISAHILSIDKHN